MAKRWVDITNLDNNTPFMQVRWKAEKWKNGDGPDCWFAEAPGLITDNNSWTDGNKDNGWFSAHRMNGGDYQGTPIYCCSFDFDHTASGYWDVSGASYRRSVKDTYVNQYGFYDTTIVIDGITYYEIDFSLWTNASNYNLYMPYSSPTLKWSAGDIYVCIDQPIAVDVDIMSFSSTGGSNTVNVTADDTWTAVVSDSWITISTLSGPSGQTTVTISTPDYQGLVNRSGTVVFTSNGFSATLTVNQRKPSTGIDNIYLGDLGVEALYLGDSEIQAIYLGDKQIF